MPTKKYHTVTKKYQEGRVVVQHNKLVNAKYSMTYIESRIFVVALSQIQPEDSDFKAYHIPVEVLDLIDEPKQNKGSLFTNVDKACKRLTERSITIKDEKGNDLNYSLMAECSYIKNEAAVRVEFSYKVKPYLLELKQKGNFTMSALRQLLKLKSFYSIRIYNLLREKKDFGERTIKMTDLRYALDVLDQYHEFNNFDNRILKPTQQELEKTDLAFDYEKIKEGRNIVAILFKLKGVPESAYQLDIFQEEINDQSSNGLRTPIPAILARFNFSEIQYNQILKAASKDPETFYRINYSLQGRNDISNKTAFAYSEFVKGLNIRSGN